MITGQLHWTTAVLDSCDVIIGQLCLTTAVLDSCGVIIGQLCWIVLYDVRDTYAVTHGVLELSLQVFQD